MAIMKIKRIGVLSMAKLKMLAGLVIGVIIGIIVMVFGGLSGIGGIASFSFLIGLAYMIALPIITFIAGAIEAFLFNFATSKLGSLEVETE